MSPIPGAGNVNPVSQPAQALSSGAVGNRFAKRPSADQVQGADDVSKLRSQIDQPDRPMLRVHSAGPAADSLQRLPESGESGRLRLRERKTANPHGQASSGAPETRTLAAGHTPYDPPLVRQRDLDLIA